MIRPAGYPSGSAAARRDASRPARAEHDGSRLAVAECDASRVDAVEVLRVCAWCTGPIPADARRDAVCCSVRCRQARHRFNRAAGQPPADPSRHTGPTRRLRLAPANPSRPEPAVGPLRLAYADPPYPGKAWLYRGHPDYAGEVDHAALIRRLGLYDGWALSTSAAALPAVLALCPPGVRVAAWHRGERPARSRWPLNAWEPVIYSGGRAADPSRADALQSRRVDSLVCGVSPLTTLPTRVTGTKPAAFCRWMFDLLGAAPGDVLDDLFPGSGVVTRAWAAYTGNPDTSYLARAGRVASVGDERDASPEILHDASPVALRYASAEAPTDASRSAAPDASCPTSAATRPGVPA